MVCSCCSSFNMMNRSNPSKNCLDVPFVDVKGLLGLSYLVDFLMLIWYRMSTAKLERLAPFVP